MADADDDNTIQAIPINESKAVGEWGSVLVRNVTQLLVEMRKNNHLTAHDSARELEETARELAIWIAIAKGDIPL